MIALVEEDGVLVHPGYFFDFAHEAYLVVSLIVQLFVAGFSNAVNLTDGLDGLAAGCAAIVVLAYIGIVVGDTQAEIRAAVGDGREPKTLERLAGLRKALTAAGLVTRSSPGCSSSR